MAKPRIEPGHIDAREACERFGRRLELAPRGVEQDEPKAHEQACAGVVGAAAPERDEKPAHAEVEQRTNRLAHAARAARLDGRAHRDRIGDADDLRGLDDRAAVGQEPERCLAHCAGCAAHLHDAAFAAVSEHGVERAFTAIGHRREANDGVGSCALDAGGDGGGHGLRAQRSFERIGRDDDDRGGREVGHDVSCQFFSCAGRAGRQRRSTAYQRPGADG